jgi:hypothetical protein
MGERRSAVVISRAGCAAVYLPRLFDGLHANGTGTRFGICYIIRQLGARSAIWQTQAKR